MLVVITLVASDTSTATQLAGRVGAALAPVSGPAERTVVLGPGAVDLVVEAAELAPIRRTVLDILDGADAGADACVQPWEGRRKRLLVADMDSTIIGCECLDELADFAGAKAQVSEITERAMRGEIGFEGALRERVGMLKGLPLTALQQCYDERVRLNSGAETLVKTMAAHGARCVLVSGGFEFFTRRVAAVAGFHADRANRLIEAGEALTGEVGEPILGREAKLAALLEEAAGLGIDPAEALAIGDGANDLAMLGAAGLGVAYRAKPLVAAEADARVDHADLTALLYFQGYRADQFSV
ncbi:phosphoserine phosphatase SerB [Phenylobacterium montanum]|uniref:Phosphoserine phosphatase n=1 Tax=Phenylobacterium montanum TaxID=2823693 RepID=A0A975G3Q4_9CAUL|nr:phosphoserine phosphatase SerB [Caulobacter sp. S6]QUD90008.1 phosphoserine phosphatase SerB [Caulobacter sp. S6]